MKADKKGTRKVYVWRMYYETESGDKHSADSVRVTDDSPPIREGFDQNYTSPLDLLKMEHPNGHPVRVYPLLERWTELRNVKGRSGKFTYKRRVEVVRVLEALPGLPPPCECVCHWAEHKILNAAPVAAPTNNEENDDEDQ